MKTSKLNQLNKTLLDACEVWSTSDAPEHVGRSLEEAVDHLRNLLEMELGIEHDVE